MDQIDELLSATIGKVVGFDLETTSLDPFTGSIKVISFAIDDPEPRQWAFRLGNGGMPYADTLKRLAPVWAHCARLIAHNLPFDFTFMAAAGYWITCPIACTLIGAKLIDENRINYYKLDALANEWLGEGKLAKYGNVGGLFGPSLTDYGAQDSVLHLKLWRFIEPRLKTEGVTRIFEDIEMAVLPYVAEMTVRGLPFDLAHLHAMRRRVRPEIDDLVARIHETVGFRFNIASPVEVGDVLFKRLKVSDKGIPKTKKGQYSTKEEYLEEIEDRHPAIPLILEYRHKNKLLSAFIEPYMAKLAAGDRIHPTYKQCEAVTGRMSCADPNTQQIDKKPDGLRGAVKAPPGYVLVQADLSQIELRLLAWRSQDRNMIQAFVEKKDLHKITGTNAAQRVGAEYSEEWRAKAKTINFGVSYGMAKKALAKKLKCTEDDAQDFIDAMFNGFPGVRGYYNEIGDLLWNQGYVTTFTGRKRRFPNYRNDRRGFTEAINHPIQGGCAEMLKLALRNFYGAVWEHRRADSNSPWWRVSVLLLVHDEIVALAPDELAHEVYDLLIDKMENVVKLNVPVVAEGQIALDWGSCKLKPKERLRRYAAAGMSPERMRFLFYRQEALVDEFLALQVT